MKITVAIDPGASGGAVAASGSEVVDVIPMPEDFQELSKWLRDWTDKADKFRVVMEQVGGYVGDGGQPGSRMFNFGEGFGFVKGWCWGAGVPFHLVTPFSWQQRLQIGMANERKDKAQWKRDLKKEAQKRFPEWAPTLKTADALLIWDYARVHCPWRS